MPKPRPPFWLWPAAALLSLGIAALAIGFRDRMLQAEALAIVLTIVLGLVGRTIWRRHFGPRVAEGVTQSPST